MRVHRAERRRLRARLGSRTTRRSGTKSERDRKSPRRKLHELIYQKS